MGHSRLQPNLQVLLKTASPKDQSLSSSPRRRRDGASTPTPLSPAFSTSSTVSGSDAGSSPELPPLPAPTLPQRALEFLRTPFGSDDEDEDGDERGFVTASWGSPYPPTTADSYPRRRLSFSSDEDEPIIRRLEISTPFLRPPPALFDDYYDGDDDDDGYGEEDHFQGGVGRDWSTGSAVYNLPSLQPANWILGLHDSENDYASEDGSEPTTAIPWSEDREQTPRAETADSRLFLPRSLPQPPSLSRSGSTETLRAQNAEEEMANPTDDIHIGDMSSNASQDSSPTPTTPSKASSSVLSFFGFSTPTRPKPKDEAPATTATPRLKKKIPYHGKNLMILLPRDDERGQPGKAPMPLDRYEVERMYQSWRQLGYSVDGFDLMGDDRSLSNGDSQSRGEWPNFADIDQERTQGGYQVTLPDLNAWKRYEDELREAKLRALGVTLGDEDPPPPLPQAAAISRPPSGQYPALPFSPPMSASSVPGNPPFPFPAQLTSVGPNSGVLSAVSPAPFAGPHGRFSSMRQSVSIPSNKSPFQMPPHGWSPGPMGHNRGSPSLMNLNGLRSPNSPFQQEFPKHGSHPAFGIHSRHQSMQFPMMQHQQPINRSHSWLQDVREVDEEAEARSPPKMPDTGHRNPDLLQAEIDDAEYHLEEQLRNQFEHEDYSPHRREMGEQEAAHQHRRQQQQLESDPSPQYPLVERFANTASQPLVLHQPRPHNRGHSLTQNLYRNGEGSDNQGVDQFTSVQGAGQKADDSFEAQTNPSNMGTPVQNYDYTSAFVPPHARNFSTTNPWKDAVSLNGGAGPRSHMARPSVSTLNVQAPEFKFNPTNNFTPGGGFGFGNKGFQPPAFQPVTSASHSSVPPSTQTSHVPQASTSVPKTNAATPSFAPGDADFNLSTSGPKSRPNAPSFTPSHSTTNSTSQASPGSNAGNTSALLFGGADLGKEALNASKSHPTESSDGPIEKDGEASESYEYDRHGQLMDKSRFKRARVSVSMEDAEAQFALPSDSAEGALAQTDKTTESPPQERPETGGAAPAEVSMLSSAASEPTDKPSAESPSVTSLEQSATNWAPFEFENNAEMAIFNAARPFGEGFFHKGHQRSLSAGAKPEAEGLAETNQVAVSSLSGKAASDICVTRIVSSPSPEPAPRGMGASRFALPPPPRHPESPPVASPPHSALDQDDVDMEVEYIVPDAVVEESGRGHWEETRHDEDAVSPVPNEDPRALIQPSVSGDNILTFDEIDAVMEHMNLHDPTHGVKKSADHVYVQEPEESPRWLEPEKAMHRSGSSYRRDDFNYYGLPTREMLSARLENPFADPPRSVRSFAATLHRPDADATSVAPSDWDRDFSDGYQEKLANRSQYFDGHVNQVVGGILESRLGPLEKTLLNIQQAVTSMHKPAHHQHQLSRRSTSLEIQESDADDEDDVEAPPRSRSPQKSKRLDQIRSVILEALASQSRHEAVTAEQPSPIQDAAVLQMLEEMKQHLVASPRAEFNGDDLKAMMEELLEKRMPSSRPTDDTDPAAEVAELKAKLVDLRGRLFSSQKVVETEVSARRAAQDTAADLERKLHAAETRVEIEIMNRSVFDQRVTDLEDKLRTLDERCEEETKARRITEDELAVNQRNLRIAVEEEHRLRGVLQDRDSKIKDLEVTVGDKAIQLALLEASQTSSSQQQAELNNRTNSLEMELKQSKATLSQLHPELDRAREHARRYQHDHAYVLKQNKHLQKVLDTLGVQLQETERIREAWRAKYANLQEDLANAHRAIAEDNTRRAKKDEATRLRQEALEARLQAESKTRERLEQEMERLEGQERNSIRAVKEARRLEELIAELRTENHQLQQRAMKSQIDFQEARASAALEIERTRRSMQIEVDEANAHVNIAREEAEIQVGNLRNEIDNVKLAAETSKMQYDMLLEDAQTTSKQRVEHLLIQIEDVRGKHVADLNDLHTQYKNKMDLLERENNASQQTLIARLDLADSKNEQLQDHVRHLEEKLEIAKEAAQAAAQRAKAAPEATQQQHQQSGTSGSAGLPEKISPQALRESIMVLQEQLLNREQAIEELEQQLSQVDTDAPSKIAKRDDEITWLRELLAVRHGDLQDVIEALEAPTMDQERAREAAIRLKANLQMEEAERERALNGGSAINLPSIAHTIREAATPRTQELSTRVAAAWGNWRRGSNIVSSSMGSAHSTPSKPPVTAAPQRGLFNGLLTPPTAGARPASSGANTLGAQPITAFPSTARRHTARRSAAQGISPGSHSEEASFNMASAKAMALPPVTSRQADEPSTPTRLEPRGRPAPRTPPMMRDSGYDSDAQAGDFDDRDFFEDDE